MGKKYRTDVRISLASSVLNQLRQPHLITIFSTHFRCVPECFHIKGSRKYMSFTEISDKIVFQYKLVDGISPSSFAIAAASRAGVPEEILEEAKKVGAFLDATQMSNIEKKTIRLANLLNLLHPQ